MLFVTAGIKLSLLTIVLGHGTALISVATTEIFAGLQKLDRAQEEASLDLGASQWRTFWRITVPNLRLSIIGAGLLIFTLSMDEIAVSFFLIGRDNTLPLEIWSRLRRGITPEINAVSAAIFAFSLVMIVLWYRLRSETQQVSQPMKSDRRSFIKFVVAGSVASGCPVDLALVAAPDPLARQSMENITRSATRCATGTTSRARRLRSRHDIVIVGGGMSGLSAAPTSCAIRTFCCSKRKSHWGGNAYLEEYAGQAFATGSAYTTTEGPA